MKTALVFRREVLPYSETFIPAQARALPTWRACLCGFQEAPSGRHLANGLPVALFSETPEATPKLLAHVNDLALASHPAIRRWYASLKKHSASVVHAHFGPDAVAARFLARALDLPLLATFHGYDITRSPSAQTAAYLRERSKVFRDATLVLAVSHYIAEALVLAGCDPQKIRIAYTGIDRSFFDGMDVDRSPEPFVLFIGRLVEKKGAHLLMRALAPLIERHPGLHVDFLGDGPDRASLEALSATLPIPIRFQGACSPDEVRSALRRAWVLCVPSHRAANGDSEGLGMAFLEAQAMRVPVASFAHGPLGEAVLDGQSGLLVPEGNISALTRALDRLLSESDTRGRFGDAGHSHVMARFDLVENSALLEQHYEEAVATWMRKGPPVPRS